LRHRESILLVASPLSFLIKRARSQRIVFRSKATNSSKTKDSVIFQKTLTSYCLRSLKSLLRSAQLAERTPPFYFWRLVLAAQQ
jgi:hypothetical protein